ncbi:hypothetical protein GGR51DRAFT_75208 [Nemania sp. FL0031]|nr:hypothetical protein GGR51DRAFT_75208 [Nemania sp. FL0031]
MTPPCRFFPASQLPTEIQVKDGKRRKGGRIDLSACELLSMVQYDCQIENPSQGDATVRCWPVQRWFRRCQDRKGNFMVETTMWETRTSPSSPVDKGPRNGGIGDGRGGA